MPAAAPGPRVRNRASGECRQRQGDRVFGAAPGALGHARWPRWRSGREGGERWGPARPGRRGRVWARSQLPVLATQAPAWLQRARAEAAAAVPQAWAADAALEAFEGLQGLLKHLHSVGEPETCVWAGELSDAQLRELEAKLRRRATAAFEVAKFQLAKNPDTSAIRADLMRPCFGEATCARVWACFCGLAGLQWSSREELLAAVVHEVSACPPADAAVLIHFARQLSENFAPLELAHRVARQDWDGSRPFALGAALLAPLERAVRELGAARPRVVVLGGCCLTAALAARLGCEVLLVEPRPLMQQLLRQILEDNGLAVAIAEVPAVEADILVWEGVDDDTILGHAHLPLLRAVLRARRDRGLAPPRLIPTRLRISAAPVDATLPRIRGCDLSRFERLHGSELALPHRWPRGACHLTPHLRAAPQHVWEIELERLADEPDLHSDVRSLTFSAEAGMPVDGVAYWVDAPDCAPGAEGAERQSPGLPSDAWVACVQPLAPRRAGARALALKAARTGSCIWFEWGEDAGGAAEEGAIETPLFPPVSKTRLPAWHFKMLNDHERNRRYDMAISRAVQRAAVRRRRSGQEGGPSVVDCGCGAGLLSMLAARAGAGTVCSLEISPIISDVTSGTLTAHLRERKLRTPAPAPPHMRVITKDVRALGPDAVGQHDVIVCELMDASGIGESVLGVLEHACRHFAAPAAQVVPCRLEIHGALGWIRVPECHGGVDFSALDPMIFCSRRGGPFGEGQPAAPPGELHAGGGRWEPGAPSLHSGPFASRNLNRLQRGEAWGLLTREAPLLDFDLAAALRGGSLHPREAEVELTASGDGVVNCVHWWWRAWLDEEETLSNRPVASGGYETHWHQPFVPLGPLPVRKGDRFRLRLAISDAIGQKFTFSLAPAAPGAASAWAGAPRLPREPLAPLLAEWPKRLERACGANSALVERYTKSGDLEGLARLQRAVQAIAACPALFQCDPHVRDRLVNSFCGVSFK